MRLLINIRFASRGTRRWRSAATESWGSRRLRGTTRDASFHLLICPSCTLYTTPIYYILYLYHLRGPWIWGPGGPGLNVRPQEFGRLARHGLFPWFLIAVCACGKQRLACCVCGYVGDEAGTTVEGCFRFRFRSVSSGNRFSPRRKTIPRFRIMERDELIRQRLVGGMVWNKLERLYR